MSERSSRADVRNPVLAIPESADLLALPMESRVALARFLSGLAKHCRAKADLCWRTHKAPMALYWKVCAVWARHLSVALRGVPLPAVDLTADLDRAVQADLELPERALEAA
jgi:hypothetical protein